MYTGNVWGIALLIAGFLAALIGFELLMGALTPKRSADAARVLRDRFWLTATLGVVGALGLVVAVAVLAQLGGPGKFLSGLLLALASFPIVGGLGVVSRCVGERMPSPADAGRPWRATLRGGVTVGLAFVVPFVGWFFVLPAALAIGFGAVLAATFVPARVPQATAADAGANA